jgi:uncharacterized protein (TIGR03435 family)
MGYSRYLAMKAVSISAIAGLLLLTSTIVAQSPATGSLAFEVASIKTPNPTGDRGTNISTSNGMLKVHNATLRFCIMAAFGIQDYLIQGGPSWINSDRYEIVAKAEGPATHDQLVLMLQKLLSDRFKLKYHRETRQRPLFTLVVAKNGPKLRASEGGETFLARRGIGATAPLTGKNASMSALAGTLSLLTGRKVLDRTELAGAYDFTLQFVPFDAVDSAIPSLTTALQEELGLKLESSTGPVDFLIVDHADKPSVD